MTHSLLPIPPLSDLLIRQLRGLRHVALDMDGTIYHGGTLYPFTNPFLRTLAGLGITYSFLTNNCSKSGSDYLTYLNKIGVEADADQIYTSAHATLEYLRHELPRVRRLYLIGTPSMAAEVSSAGYLLACDSPGDEPDAVLVAFDTALNYAQLCRAAWWIKCGKPFLATHPDRVCPTDQPTVLVDCGSICAALESATGRAPDAILGKPDPRMLQGLLHRMRLKPGQLAMVGDRLYTDIEMARRAGALGVLVLTGEATAAQAAQADRPPDLTVADIGVLGKLLESAFSGKTS